jgi:hypothetical protein
MAPNKASLLLAELRGQQMRVPNLSPLFANWKQGINPHYKTIIPFVNEIVDRVVSEKRHLNAARASDFALFAARLVIPFWDSLRWLTMKSPGQLRPGGGLDQTQVPCYLLNVPLLLG